jgi:hypothetical protein
MHGSYRSDRERSVNRGKAWEKFKSFIQQSNKGVDIEAMLKKTPLKKNPVVSCGIIEFVKKPHAVYYHVFKRRNTMEYDILIRGFAAKSQLFDLLCLISRDERDRILNSEWTDIWDDYWIDHDSGGYTSWRAQSERKFPEIREILKLIDEEMPCRITTRPNVFPKGKPDLGETGFQAAIREAREETKDAFLDGRLYFNDPICQKYTGSDERQYIDYYYVWERDELYQCKTQHLETIRYHDLSSDVHVLGTKSVDGFLLNPSVENVRSTSPVFSYTDSNKQLVKEVRPRLRDTTISHELESEDWIEVPIFDTYKELIEWENSIDPYSRFGVFQRHFSCIMDIHKHLYPV